MSKWQTFKKDHVLLYNALFTVAVPAAVWLIMELLNLAFCGVHTLNSVIDYTTLMRNLVTSFCFALGLNCNLPVGRMDTSTGSQMYLACILGGNLALSLNLGGVGVLLFSMVIGMLAGGFVGVLFVNLRILPMVLGLGISLVYECISFSMYNQQGLNLFGKQGVSILSNWGFIIVVMVIIMAVMTFLFQYSSFGYNRRAIQGNQKLANDAGINIYINAVLCYIAAGALVSIAGVFDTAYKSNLVPVLGMSSNSTVFANMFPMAVGVWLAKKSNPVIGIVAGSLSVQFLILGLSKFTMIGVSDYMQTCIRYSIWLIFMIYRMNEDKIARIKERHARVALARATRAKRAVPA
ncbi:ABC transporter permease subunit [Subdoligranulum variabile]|uniref:ABC transporter permease subunit n=1 Tax=Subdoligranulum variabile TaxID=214851 RepID=UPI002942A189|nr:ABC transporter permease [Subdoligranulum variabile]